MSPYQEYKKIQKFIENGLERKLKDDQKNYRIVSEGDLQSCVYHHLRIFIDKKTSNWHVLNKWPMGIITEPKKFPDIAIVYMEKEGVVVYPTFLIELKEDFENFQSKRVKSDVEKLLMLATKKNSQLVQTYFIYALLDEKLTPKQIVDKIVNLTPNPDDEWVFPIAINIIGEKQFFREMKNFKAKVKRLRKYSKN